MAHFWVSAADAWLKQIFFNMMFYIIF